MDRLLLLVAHYRSSSTATSDIRLQYTLQTLTSATQPPITCRRNRRTRDLKCFPIPCSHAIPTLHPPNSPPTSHCAKDLLPHNSDLATHQAPQSHKPNTQRQSNRNHASLRKADGIPRTCRMFETYLQQLFQCILAH